MRPCPGGASAAGNGDRMDDWGGGVYAVFDVTIRF